MSVTPGSNPIPRRQGLAPSGADPFKQYTQVARAEASRGRGGTRGRGSPSRATCCCQAGVSAARPHGADERLRHSYTAPWDLTALAAGSSPGSADGPELPPVSLALSPVLSPADGPELSSARGRPRQASASSDSCRTPTSPWSPARRSERGRPTRRARRRRPRGPPPRARAPDPPSARHRRAGGRTRPHADATSTTSRSALIAASACLRAHLFCRTAASTTSRSALSAEPACLRARPFHRTFCKMACLARATSASVLATIAANAQQRSQGTWHTLSSAPSCRRKARGSCAPGSAKAGSTGSVRQRRRSTYLRWRRLRPHPGQPARRACSTKARRSARAPSLLFVPTRGQLRTCR